MVDSAALRTRRAENPKTRARDLAEAHGLPEAALVAAHLGHGVTALAPHPDQLIPLVGELGDVMALTRNRNCVHERKGVYRPYHSGTWAQMVLSPEIDLRIFAKHWVHAYAVEEGDKRSIQVFDAAGDAVHKIHLTAASDVAGFDRLVAALAVPGAMPDFSPRAAVEPARGDAQRAEALRKAWAAMTDSHQFLGMVKDLGMNRLGANRIAGAPHARPLQKGAVLAALELAAFSEIPVMIFVGNAGCIQIHSGPIGKTTLMGPWINIMDPRFNLHLRGDRIAEVWHVVKPTATGPAVSIEAFDADGELILQIFAYRKDRTGEAWNAMVEALPHLEEAFA
ncbi:hemin-degrading factor [Stagnihabitans tardus]|uniref:Hemin-degrading factor n=1 Tax=Stagnihabitans tardus TaxID=2699202 RepID=A0AAE5BU76_9RHOB|nr:ChuX/HutX family heme-like substrate-binding protein [Stagnihabitans tardus]NBZ86464.1 hemin-degrading factor [Stagnihabitans tardus]